MNKISLDYYTPIKDKPGYVEFHSMKSLGVVRDQLNAVLEAIVYDADDELNASNIAEWIEVEGSETDLAPQGEPFAAMTYGNCEGYILRLFVMNRQEGGAIQCIISIKYLSDEEFVYKVAKIVNKACNEGMYSHDEPPTDTRAG